MKRSIVIVIASLSMLASGCSLLQVFDRGPASSYRYEEGAPADADPATRELLTQLDGARRDSNAAPDDPAKAAAYAQALSACFFHGNLTSATTNRDWRAMRDEVSARVERTVARLDALGSGRCPMGRRTLPSRHGGTKGGVGLDDPRMGAEPDLGAGDHPRGLLPNVARRG